MKTKNALLSKWIFNLFSSISVFLLVFSFFSCISSKYVAITGYDYRKITTNQREKLDFSSINYTKIAEGIFIARIEQASFPLVATIAKIDLKEEHLKIVATEQTRFVLQGFYNGFVKPEKTLSFAKRCNTNLAINANFFNFTTSFLDKLYKPLGLFVSNGMLLSPNREDFAPITFDEAKKVSMQKGSFEDAQFGIAGYNKVIEEGNIVLKGKSKRVDSRTLIGLNKVGDELFILLIDGERKTLSRGLSLIDAARFFLEMGVFEGIELDGGGSSTLVAKIEGVQHQLVPSAKKQCRRVAVNLGFISQ